MNKYKFRISHQSGHVFSIIISAELFVEAESIIENILSRNNTDVLPYTILKISKKDTILKNSKK